MNRRRLIAVIAQSKKHSAIPDTLARELTGYDITAVSEQECIEKAALLKADVIILPEIILDGRTLELCRELKLAEATGSIPIMILSKPKSDIAAVNNKSEAGPDSVLPANTDIAVIRNSLELLFRIKDIESRLTEKVSPHREPPGGSKTKDQGIPDKKLPGISQLKQFQDDTKSGEVRSKNQRNTIARIALDKVIASGTQKDAFNKLAREIGTTVGTERTSIWLFSEDKAILECQSLYEFDKKNPREHIILKRADYPRYFNAIRNESLVIASDARQDPRTNEFRDNYLIPLGITSMLDAGINAEGEMIGIICLEHRGEKREWQTDEASFVSTVASIAGQIVVNERRRKTQEALAESELMYRSLIESSSDAIYCVDKSGHFKFTNRLFAGIFEREPEYFINKTFKDFFPKRQANKLYRSTKNVFESGETESWEVQIPVNDREVSYWVSLNPVKDNKGNVTLCLTHASDITKLKEERVMLSTALDRNEALLYAIPDIMFLFDGQNKIVDFKANNPKDLYMQPENFLNKNIADVLPGELSLGIQEKVAKVIKEKAPQYMNYTMFIDGADRDFESRFVPCGKDLVLSIVRDVTDKISAERTLKESEERYKNFISQVSEGVYRFELDDPMPLSLDIESQVDFMYDHMFIAECNKAFIEMYGIKNESEIIGKSLKEIHGGSENPENREAQRQFIASGFKTENLVTIEPDASGALRYFSNNAIGIIENDHLVRSWGTQTDITPRMKTELELIKLSSAVEQSPASVIITNLNGTIEYVNGKFTEVSGYTPDEVLGKNTRMLKSGEVPPNVYSNLWESIKNGETWTGELQNKKKDGELYWESVSISPILDSAGEMKYYLAIKEDITESKLMRENLLEALEKAKESDRLKSAFLANMSHEIRTPMNGILGFAELLREPGLSAEKQKDFISIIEKSGERMLNTINSIIDISKIESGLIKVDYEESNINNQVDFIYDFFKMEMENKGLEFHARKGLPDEDSIIRTDVEKIYAILTNLVKNAVKFTTRGAIEFGYVHKGEFLEFFVKDSGHGISREKQDVIFKRFRQGSEALNRSYEGSGLGLAISKYYAELLNGKIWVESEKGIGSTFFFTIPYSRTSDIPSVSQPDPVQVTSGRSDTRLKVLLTEDDHYSRLLVSNLVDDISKEVIHATTGQEAVEICRKESDLDLVLMDIQLPGMSGLDAVREIRKFNTGVIIIAQTAYGFSDDREKALAAGCNDYISKPIFKNDLLEMISKYFN